MVSNASCTTNCLAPVAKVLHENFGIEKGLMTTVHAYTNDQQLLDMPHSGYAQVQGSQPEHYSHHHRGSQVSGPGAPGLKGKLNGFAMRVPTPNVSVVDLVVELSKPVTVEEINRAFQEAAAGPLKGDHWIIVNYPWFP